MQVLKYCIFCRFLIISATNYKHPRLDSRTILLENNELRQQHQKFIGIWTEIDETEVDLEFRSVRKAIWEDEYLNRMIGDRLKEKVVSKLSKDRKRRTFKNVFDGKILYKCMRSAMGRIFGHIICKRHVKVSI